MHYQRHSFKHNFLNAVETDADLALDVLVNEINELVLDQPKDVIEMLKKLSIRVPNSPKAKDLAVLINEQVTTSEELRNALAELITKRHENKYVNADGGAMDFDFTNTESEQAKPQKTRISVGIAKTFGVIENLHDTKVDVDATKKVMLENLNEKMAQKGITTDKQKILKIVGLCVLGAAIIGTLIYLAKPKKQG